MPRKSSGSFSNYCYFFLGSDSCRCDFSLWLSEGRADAQKGSVLRSLTANAEWHGLGFLRGTALHSQLQHLVMVCDPHSPGMNTQLTRRRVLVAVCSVCTLLLLCCARAGVVHVSATTIQLKKG